ncbi:SprT-like family-domain-containing protein [Podospora australis]|uniref:SprT-like family-domain-containing protein n=1 Tax=Podospora australis TaxID=1536484 RepID=A0AAN7AN67_9PEZI|nr:SprT-like family-domain-containing protein [Podospora australis]
MARLAGKARPVLHWSSDEDDDDDSEFPDVLSLIRTQKKDQADEKESQERTAKPAKAPAVRVRKLAPVADSNALLRAWTPESGVENEARKPTSRSRKEEEEPRRPRVELRTRKTQSTVVTPSSPSDQDEDFLSAREEVTIIEEVSIMDDTFHSCASEDSEFGGTICSEDEEDDDDDYLEDSPPPRSSVKLRAQIKEPQALPEAGKKGAIVETTRKPPRKVETDSTKKTKPRPSTSSITQEKSKQPPRKDLAYDFSKLRLDGTKLLPARKPSSSTPELQDFMSSDDDDGENTPVSSTPPKEPQGGLVSPKKLPRIPSTPHRPSTDMFWSRDFVDDWNDQHSPKKQLFPDAVKSAKRNKDGQPEKTEITTTTKKTPAKKSTAAAQEREAKKVFSQTKTQIATSFLAELDQVITNNQLATLTAPTDGIQIIWSKTLNTTAGRANWKCQTTTTTDGIEKKKKHFASIELSDKVIDDELRLLNVVAHEFCHLANYMITGLTTNPHGKEFKEWGAKCEKHFGKTRGIVVTTKHTYEIDFKYVWSCVECLTEYKRHSKSIDPLRHKCGRCKGTLNQVKPVPRKSPEADGGDGVTAKKPSEYQVFMKEQMRLIKAETPKTPQKDIMKIVAGRWALHKEKNAAGKATLVEDVTKVMKRMDVKGDRKIEIVDLT